MIPLIPKELIGKIEFKKDTVFLKQDANEREKKIFEDFKQSIDQETKARFE